jgi:hypothetical protein
MLQFIVARQRFEIVSSLGRRLEAGPFTAGAESEKETHRIEPAGGKQAFLNGSTRLAARSSAQVRRKLQ